MTAITLHDTDDTTRRAKTIPRNTTRYSHDSLGHCEEVEKQIRVFIFRTSGADHECDRDRRAAWTFTQFTVDAEEPMTFLKWMSEDENRKVVKFAEELVPQCCQDVEAGKTVERCSLGWKVESSR